MGYTAGRITFDSSILMHSISGSLCRKDRSKFPTWSTHLKLTIPWQHNHGKLSCMILGCFQSCEKTVKRYFFPLWNLFPTDATCPNVMFFVVPCQADHRMIPAPCQPYHRMIPVQCQTYHRMIPVPCQLYLRLFPFLPHANPITGWFLPRANPITGWFLSHANLITGWFLSHANLITGWFLPRAARAMIKVATLIQV